MRSMFILDYLNWDYFFSSVFGIVWALFMAIFLALFLLSCLIMVAYWITGGDDKPTTTTKENTYDHDQH